MLNRIRLSAALAAAAMTCAAATASASAAVTHTVRRGETLTSIAAQDGLSVTALAAANGMSATAPLTAGAQLVIPAQGASVASEATSQATTAAVQAPVATQAPATTGASAPGGYLVPRGATLTAIAAQYGTTPSALAAANGLSVNGVLLAGSTLSLPGDETAAAPASATPATTTSANTTPTTTTSATATPAAATSVGDTPQSQFVSPSEVGALAEQDGVPAALAEAVAEQESGFNDAEVSVTGATGVMQIEPGTWADLSRSGMDLSPDSAIDNVRGGVAVLRSLLTATGGDQAPAIAAYYQGLASVRARGMYPSTQQYVSDVLALEGRFGG